MNRTLPITLAVMIFMVTALRAEPLGNWLTGHTGKGTARWTVGGGTLTYRGGATFAWAVLPHTPVRDGFVQVRFRPISGREDQAGGVVWRWQDANNYYLGRANALEGNVVAYKVVNGRRTDMKPVGASGRAYGVKTPVASGAWHILRVDFAGPECSVTFDGQRLFRVRDQTFPEPGAVGVWSMTDSVTEFDAFKWGKK